MNILMLGNSFTSSNQLPELLANLTKAAVIAHTRGGARLAEHRNPETKLGKLTQAALQEQSLDFVILQEMSNGPIVFRERFLESVRELSVQIRAAGAEPVLFATWAYQNGSRKLRELGMEYEEMHRKLYEAYHEAALQNHLPVADVGLRFYELAEHVGLYREDGIHPNEYGTKVAAKELAEVILKVKERRTGC